LIKLNSRRKSNPINKWANELNRLFLEEEIQIANQCMKKCSMSLAIMEMQIKTTLRIPLTPVRLTIIKKTYNKNKQACERKRTIYKLLKEM
jgi:hypothetical protein